MARPIERAWAALTIPARLAEWLGPIADLDLRVGGHFMVWFDRESDDAVRGRITAYAPPHLLAFDWNEAGGDLGHRFELAAEAGGCRITFTQTGLRQTTPGMQALFVCGGAAGWGLFMDDLVRAITGAAPPHAGEPFEVAERRYRARFGPFLPGHDVPPALRGHESEPFVTPAGEGFSKLRFSRVYGPPADRIWAALTQPARIARWYGRARIDLTPGGDVVFDAGGGAVDRGFIVTLEPGRRIAWALPLADGRHTVVDWALAPWEWSMATVTRLSLTLRDVPQPAAPEAAAIWMRRLHDLAEAARA